MLFYYLSDAWVKFFDCENRMDDYYIWQNPPFPCITARVYFICPVCGVMLNSNAVIYMYTHDTHTRYLWFIPYIVI